MTCEIQPSAEKAQERLLELLVWQIRRYTKGESSSVPVDTAQALLESLCYTLSMKPSDMRHQRLLEQENLQTLYARGVGEIRRKMLAGKKLWAYLCRNSPGFGSRSHGDTLRGIGVFWRRYDWHFFAQEIPGDIDYQLCHPVSDTLLGVDYICAYLKNLAIESSFLNCFAPKRVQAVLGSYCRDYRELLVNLYEPVAANALGCAILEKPVRGLEISDEDLAGLRAAIAPRSGLERKEMFRQAAYRVCTELEITQPDAWKYLECCLANLLPRIEAALPTENLGGIFTVEK